MRCMLAVVLVLAGACAPPGPAPGEGGGAGEKAASGRVVVGAEVLLEESPAWLTERRVALLSNRGATVGGAEGLRPLHEALAEHAHLVKLLAPEHGVDLDVEAGGEVVNDEGAGRVPVRSWYGADAAQREADLSDVDVLLFDLPDVGSRWFTYIGTMRLAMEAALATGTRFVVLDRPNPLGGEVVEGWVTEPEQRSLVASLPVPIRHGMTVGELARMIVGEGWIEGAEELDLEVVTMRGWERSMLWSQTGLEWSAPSPNLPTFESALVYAGTCLIEATTLNEGRGTEQSFLQFGAPHLEVGELIGFLEGEGVLSGLEATAVRYTPRSIPGRAESPRFEGEEVAGVRLSVEDAGAVRPLQLGFAILVWLQDNWPEAIEPKWLGRLAGTRRAEEMLVGGATVRDIVASFSQVGEFLDAREQFLLYPNRSEQ